MRPSLQVVVDLGFGDSGKGLVTDWLCRHDPLDTLVLRWGGGHQVGHTVQVRDTGGTTVRHTFSNFGSGTLQGCRTWYGKDTVAFFPAMAAEAGVLAGKGCREHFNWLDPRAMVCTPWDIAWNRVTERRRGHGSCGVGFGATVERHLRGMGLRALDCRNAWVVREKLRSIGEWYGDRAILEEAGLPGLRKDWEEETGEFDLDAMSHALLGPGPGVHWDIAEGADLAVAGKIPGRLVMEGHQGIMLDQDWGIAPHVTWSSTGSASALECVGEFLAGTGLGLASVDIWYVTRAYQTRHGTGPMSSGTPVDLVNTESETNVTHPWQGEFRRAALDPDLVAHARRCDRVGRAQALERLGLGRGDCREHLVITCLDQVPGFEVEALLQTLGDGFASVRGSWGPDSKDLRLREA